MNLNKPRSIVKPKNEFSLKFMCLITTSAISDAIASERQLTSTCFPLSSSTVTSVCSILCSVTFFCKKENIERLDAFTLSKNINKLLHLMQ